MDKDKNHDTPDHSPWMDMHQFIGDLLASSSGSSAKEQADVMNAWSTLGGDAFQQRVRPMHDKTEAALRKSKPRDEPHHVCTCPGCPFSCPRQASYSLLHSEAPKERGPSSTAAAARNSLPLSSADGCPEASGSSDADSPSSRLSSLSRLSSVFPCCAFCHTHHHFHHHHCPISTCLPCPPPSFPCLASFKACPHQRGSEERGRPATAGPSHPCMHCPASFSRPSQLLQHQRAEHTHKPSGFLCTHCGRTFNSHSNLRIHLHVHTGARPYTCSDCGKGFSQSGALKIHRRIHTGERPYSCGFCGRGFPHLAGVRAHQRIHTGEKPYRCSQCGKCFTQSGALKIHIRIHTGERPFVCTICDKAFSNRSGIRFHNQTVHGLAPEQAAPAGVPLGRPRAYPPPALLSAPHGPDSTMSSQTESRSGLALLGGNASKCQTEGENARLMYACEDCGLRFKDAPSRNKHQSLVHYSAEDGPAKESSANEGATPDSGE